MPDSVKSNSNFSQDTCTYSVIKLEPVVRWVIPACVFTVKKQIIHNLRTQDTLHRNVIKNDQSQSNMLSFTLPGNKSIPGIWGIWGILCSAIVLHVSPLFNHSKNNTTTCQWAPMLLFYSASRSFCKYNLASSALPIQHMISNLCKTTISN